MAQLEFSSVLTNPLLCDRFQVRRRVQTVGPNGRNVSSDTLTWQTGVVQADGDNTQVRDAEQAAGRKTISIITRFRLRDQTAGFLPDVILWRGDEFLCDAVDDMTNYGTGFVEATCISQDAQDAAPGGS